MSEDWKKRHDAMHAQLLRLDKCDVFGDPKAPNCKCRSCLSEENKQLREEIQQREIATRPEHHRG